MNRTIICLFPPFSFILSLLFVLFFSGCSQKTSKPTKKYSQEEKTTTNFQKRDYPPLTTDDSKIQSKPDDTLQTTSAQQNISGLAKNKSVHGYDIFIVKPFSSTPTLPKTNISTDRAGNVIKLQGAPGETLTASFVFRPTKHDVNSLIVKATNIQSKENEGVIPSKAVDICIVKCWYQAYSAWSSHDFKNKKKVDQRILVPELLLHDPTLVRVDYEKHTNKLKLSDGSYVLISQNKVKNYPGQIIPNYKARVDIPASELPVADDSKTLQPVAVRKSANQQFWITLQIPNDAKVGRYTGQLNINNKTGEIGNIKLHLYVLPIKLGQPHTFYNPDNNFTYSIYYRGRLSKNGKAYIGSDYKSKVQLKAELRDMKQHGMDFVTNYTSLNNTSNFKTSLKIYRHIFDHNSLYLVGTNNLGLGLSTSEKAFFNLKKRAKKLNNLAHSAGYKHIYVYGMDELGPNKVHKERAIWNRLHEYNIRVFVAGKRSVSTKVNDVLDVLIASWEPLAKVAKLMHQYNNRVFSYANPQSGPENPKLYRTHYGIKLWKRNYDGAMTYAYQSAVGSIWNDFDSHAGPFNRNFRDEVFSYPTTHGVINTIAWEGYAQAKRDVKYASKLMQLADKWEQSQNDKKKSIAREAHKYIDHLKISLDTNLQEVRNKIIQYILKLNN